MDPQEIPAPHSNSSLFFYFHAQLAHDLFAKAGARRFRLSDPKGHPARLPMQVQGPGSEPDHICTIRSAAALRGSAVGKRHGEGQKGRELK